MNRKANVLVVLAVLTLGCVLAKDEAAAQAITVTPANPTISVGQTQQFRATGISTAVAVAAGCFHTCALLANGTVQCWGENDFGQLGNGTSDPVPGSPTTVNPTPVTVSGMTTAVAISAGGWHTCARLGDGRVQCWGQNTYGQLGDGATIAPSAPSRSPTPVTVTGITTAVAMEAGIFHTCALLADGTLQCWGRNDEGRLGNGTTANSSTPTTVSGITPAAVAPGAEHACALFQDGTVRCWGDNNWGQLGNNSAVGATSTTPSTAVTGITTATAASSGAEHTCAVLQGGFVQCWGRNTDGRLGNGTTTNAFTPVTVVGLGVTWTSSDATVATIDAAGLATGRSPGFSVITASSGGRSGSTTLTVRARFSLAVIREGTGNGTVTSNPPGIDCGANCSASYDGGTVVTLTATSAPDSTFEGWTGGGCSGTGPCTVTLTENRTGVARV